MAARDQGLAPSALLPAKLRPGAADTARRAGKGGMTALSVTATEVRGRTMLIERIERLSFVCHLIGVHARLETGEQVCFHAPTIVEAQLRKNKPFPIWAKLVAVEVKKRTYYKLIFAQTVSWQRAEVGA